MKLDQKTSNELGCSAKTVLAGGDLLSPYAPVERRICH